ncbi:MAG TPA: helix-turn-helix transcriptional regulator, partial [Streptosporangiaceae bacterium]|nr:helix-turn-helix transcriptional regulator [Streptosporangiaceae bacterium]
PTPPRRPHPRTHGADGVGPRTWPPRVAHALAQACEGARTPALLAAAAPLPLTSREREIVTLAARGLTNRQIAEWLVVSVRTVEGHLYRASTKLGASGHGKLLVGGQLSPGSRTPKFLVSGREISVMT